MNTATSLPALVLKAAASGRKIEAIKLLRVERGIGLKEAKEIIDGIDSHSAEQAGPALARSRNGEVSGIGRLLGVCLLLGCVIAAYYFL
jgi:ribosomal protein L7/L12